MKLLLANKSDIYLKGHHNGKERFAWEIAQMHGHVKIAKYINACVGKSLAIQFNNISITIVVLGLDSFKHCIVQTNRLLLFHMLTILITFMKLTTTHCYNVPPILEVISNPRLILMQSTFCHYCT